MYKIKHKELGSLIREYYKQKLSLFVFGTFGIGKSHIVRDVGIELAKEKGKEFVNWNKLSKEDKDKVFNNPSKYFVLIDERLSEKEPSDMIGLPSFMEDSEVLNWKMPYWAKFVNKPDSDGILFFDEVNLASPIVVSSVYKIIYDRIIGEESINDNWLMMGAGNLDSDNAFTFSLPAPVKDRGGEVELLVPNKDDWTKWAVSHNIDSRIIGFINFKESSLYNVDFNNNQKYTTPRGWERVSSLIKDRIVDDAFELLVCSAIGEGIAREFITFCKLKEKIDLEGIIRNPNKLKNVKDVGIRYLITTSIAERFKDEGKNSVDFKKIMEVSRVLDESNTVDFVALLWNMCLTYTKDSQKFEKGYLEATDKETLKLLDKFGSYII